MQTVQWKDCNGKQIGIIEGSRRKNESKMKIMIKIDSFMKVIGRRK